MRVPGAVHRHLHCPCELSLAQQAAAEQKIQEMAEAGVILEPSSSGPHPLSQSRKKTAFFVNYHHLHKVTHRLSPATTHL